MTIVKVEKEPFHDFGNVAMRQVHQMSTPVILSVGKTHVRIASVRSLVYSADSTLNPKSY